MRAAPPYADPADTPEVKAEWQEMVTAAFKEGSLYWIASAVEDKYYLEGKCPRCHHPMDQVHRMKTWFSDLNVEHWEGASGATREVNAAIPLVLECNCEPPEGAHKPNTTGCGFAPSIEVEVPNPELRSTMPAFRLVGNAEKAEREYWDGMAEKANHEQLKAVQASAAKWTAITCTLLGLFGTVAFATGLDSIGDLPNDFLRWGVRGATTVAFVLILIGTWQLAKAAGGLQLDYAADGFGGDYIELKTKARADSAKKELGRGKVAALVGTAIILLGTVVIFWSDKAPATPSKVAGVTTNGQVVCGELTPTGFKTTIGSSTEPVTSIITVVKCPGS
jgi:hypothetical protein